MLTMDSDKWSGAAAIENENGQIVNLRVKSLEDVSRLIPAVLFSLLLGWG
jgi:hypothetical protein